MWFNQFCPVQEIECAVQDAKLCSPKRQIIKNLVTRHQISMPKCTNSILAGVLPQTLGEFAVLAIPLAGFKSPTSTGRERKRRFCSYKKFFHITPPRK